jgi:hypothetical protein
MRSSVNRHIVKVTIEADGAEKNFRFLVGSQNLMELEQTMDKKFAERSMSVSVLDPKIFMQPRPKLSANETVNPLEEYFDSFGETFSKDEDTEGLKIKEIPMKELDKVILQATRERKIKAICKKEDCTLIWNLKKDVLIIGSEEEENLESVEKSVRELKTPEHKIEVKLRNGFDYVAKKEWLSKQEGGNNFWLVRSDDAEVFLNIGGR